MDAGTAQTSDRVTGRLTHETGSLKRALSSAAPALLHGLRLTTAVCLALCIAFWLQLDSAHWAGTSAAIVAQPALGASLRKGRFRAIGTIVGGILIVLLTAAFPQDHGVFLLGLTLWAVICGLLTAMLRNFAGYAAALAGYTAVLVFAGIIDNPQNVFMVAVWRVTEISTGIFSTVIVHSLTDFGNARLRLERALSEVGETIAAGIVRTLQTDREDLELRTSRRALIKRVSALDTTIDEAMGEPSHLRHCRRHLQAVLESLFVALSAWRGMANHLATVPPYRRDDLVQSLLPSLAALLDRAWWSDPRAIRGSCDAGGRILAKMAGPDLSARVLNDELGRILDAFRTVANGLLLVNTPGLPWSVRGRMRIHVPDPFPGTLDALRIFIALTAVELFWVATGWPHGPTMLIFTAIGVILFARQADAAYSSALEFGLGCGLAAVLAAILLLAILPSIHGGILALSTALALFLLPLGALSAGSWHKTLFVATVTNLIPILAIENETNYGAAGLFNVAVAVIAGTAVPVMFFRLFPPMPAARRIQRLLMLSLRDLRRLLAGRQRSSQAAWLDLTSRRLAALPEQATLEEGAELLAALSVGQACIALLAAPASYAAHDTLERALASLAEANTAEAYERFIGFAAAQSGRHAVDGGQGTDAAVQATLIADALERHGRFFSRKER
jgi:uncharacterized membrane protein YccC